MISAVELDACVRRLMALDAPKASSQQNYNNRPKTYGLALVLRIS